LVGPTKFHWMENPWFTLAAAGEKKRSFTKTLTAWVDELLADAESTIGPLLPGKRGLRRPRPQPSGSKARTDVSAVRCPSLRGRLARPTEGTTVRSEPEL
jgi:hypothetical protein